VYGFGEVAPTFVPETETFAPTPDGHAAGVGSEPRFVAPLQASFAGCANRYPARATKNIVSSFFMWSYLTMVFCFNPGFV
jgi:hypothetical protein